MARHYDYEFQGEMSPLHEYELEADRFFGGFVKRLGGAAKALARRAAPILKQIAPTIAAAIPGAGAIAGPVISALTQEQRQELEALLHEAGAMQHEAGTMHSEWESVHPEYEGINPEWESVYSEYEGVNPEWESVHPEYEGINPEWESVHPEYGGVNPEWESVHPEYEGINPEWESVHSEGMHQEYEGIHPEYESGLPHSEVAHQEAMLMEQIAYEAAQTASVAEAEAMVGALVPLSTRALQAAAPQLRQVTPALVQATKKLTKALGRSPATRPLIETVPTILRRTNNMLARQARHGRPISPRTAVRTMAQQTYRVIGNPVICIYILIRSGRLRRRGHLRPRPEAMPY